MKNPQTDEEHYYYHATKTSHNALNEIAEPFSYQGYGYHRKPILDLQWSDGQVEKVPRIVDWQSTYTLKWDPVQVKKLLNSSFLPCESFYIGKTHPRDMIEEHYYTILNKNDFLNSKWEDLFDLGRLGISYEHESLNLAEAARKQERENRETSVGLRTSQPAT